MKKLAIAAGAALLVAACGGSGGGEVAAACMAGGELNRATCDCISNRAVADLTSQQRANVVRAMREDAGVDDLPIGEQMVLASFMADAGLSCIVEHGE
jgi:hypothetical protein